MSSTSASSIQNNLAKHFKSCSTCSGSRSFRVNHDYRPTITFNLNVEVIVHSPADDDDDDDDYGGSSRNDDGLEVY